MDFDERIIEKEHVHRAIERYAREKPYHRAAKSAFLVWNGQRLPAKFILRLAFEVVTGHIPKPETLTGGSASVRVLNNLGFETIYVKPERKSGSRNAIKSARREALKKILESRFGQAMTEWKDHVITVPDLDDRRAMDPSLLSIINAIESHRGMRIRGRKGHRLAFDLYFPKADLVVEFDERQHFTPLRTASLRAYPANTPLGFDTKRWISLSEEIRAGDNSPAYRDEQRAFYDSIRDIFAPRSGLLPVVRVFEEDVAWEKEKTNGKAAQRLIAQIENICQSIR